MHIDENEVTRFCFTSVAVSDFMGLSDTSLYIQKSDLGSLLFPQHVPKTLEIPVISGGNADGFRKKKNINCFGFICFKH